MSALPQTVGEVLGACQHGRMLVVRRTIAGGGIQIVKQCQECGRPVGSAMPHSSVHTIEGLPAFDNALMDRVDAANRAQWEAKKAATDLAALAWREEYEAYLLTPQWRAKRDLALKRDDWTCQGCLAERATQVHHLTYSHLGSELLFQLISLCDECHEWEHHGRRGGA